MGGGESRYILGRWGWVDTCYGWVEVGGGMFWVGEHFYGWVGVGGGIFLVGGGVDIFMGGWGWVGVSGGIFWVVEGGWTFFMGGWGWVDIFYG